MASLRKRGTTWYYRYVDADGIKRERKGCSDKRATEQMAAHAESEAAKIRDGLIDPRADAYRRHEVRPLSEHLAGWRDDLIARGGTAKHAELYADRARRLAALACGAALADIEAPNRARRTDRGRAEAALSSFLAAARLSDLNPERVQGALAVLRGAGRSLATCNHHRGAIRSFSRWCCATGRTRDDALRGVTGFNAKEDRRHDRRTLSLEELRRLIEAAGRGVAFQGMTGPARALC